MMYVGRFSTILIVLLISSVSMASSLHKQRFDLTYDSKVGSTNYSDGDQAEVSGSICLNKRVYRGRTYCSKLDSRKYEIVATFPTAVDEVNLNKSGSRYIKYSYTTPELRSGDLNQFSLAVVRKGAKNSKYLISLKSKYDYKVNIIQRRIDLYQNRIDNLSNKYLKYYQDKIAHLHTLMKRASFWRRYYYRYQIWRYQRALRNQESRLAKVRYYYQRKINILVAYKSRYSRVVERIAEYLTRDPDLYAKIDIPLMVEGRSFGDNKYQSTQRGYRLGFSVNDAPIVKNNSYELSYSLIPMNFGYYRADHRKTYKVRIDNEVVFSKKLNAISKDGEEGSFFVESALLDKRASASIEDSRGRIYAKINFDLPVVDEVVSEPVIISESQQDFSTKDVDYELSFNIEHSLATSYEVIQNGNKILEGEEKDFSRIVSLVEGENHFEIIVRDENNSSASLTLSAIVLDSIAPVLNVEKPAVGEYFNSRAILVDGSANENLSSVIINGEEVAVSGSSFSHSLTLDSDGATNIQIEAFDLVGNKTELSRAVNIDTVAPVLSLNGEQNISTNNANYSFSFVVNDENSVTTKVYLNGSLEFEGADKSKVIDLLLSSGTNSIRVESVDTSGNSTSASLVGIILDSSPAAITLVTPLDGTTQSESKVIVSGSSDEELSEVLINNSQAILSSDKKSFNLELNQESEGRFTINIVAFDRARNQTEVSRSITMDKSAPIISEVEPGNEIIYTKDSISISGVVRDSLSRIEVSSITAQIVGEGLSLDIKSNLVFEDLGEEKAYRFSGNIQDLSEGSYVLSIRASDEALNRSSALERSIVVDKTAPVISIGDYPKEVDSSEFSLSLTIEDPLAISTEIYLNDSLISTLSDASIVQELSLVSGENIIRVVSTDDVGNVAEAEFDMIIYNKVIPNFFIAGPDSIDVINSTKSEGAFFFYNNTTEDREVEFTIDSEVGGISLSYDGRLKVSEGAVISEIPSEVILSAVDEEGSILASKKVILNTLAREEIGILPVGIISELRINNPQARYNGALIKFDRAVQVDSPIKVYESVSSRGRIYLTLGSENKVDQPFSIIDIPEDIQPIYKVSSVDNIAILSVPNILIGGGIVLLGLDFIRGDQYRTCQVQQFLGIEKSYFENSEEKKKVTSTKAEFINGVTYYYQSSIKDGVNLIDPEFKLKSDSLKAVISQNMEILGSYDYVLLDNSTAKSIAGNDAAAFVSSRIRNTIFINVDSFARLNATTILGYLLHESRHVYQYDKLGCNIYKLDDDFRELINESDAEHFAITHPKMQEVGEGESVSRATNYVSTVRFYDQFFKDGSISLDESNYSNFIDLMFQKNGLSQNFDIGLIDEFSDYKFYHIPHVWDHLDYEDFSAKMIEKDHFGSEDIDASLVKILGKPDYFNFKSNLIKKAYRPDSEHLASSIYLDVYGDEDVEKYTFWENQDRSSDFPYITSYTLSSFGSEYLQFNLEAFWENTPTFVDLVVDVVSPDDTISNGEVSLSEFFISESIYSSVYGNQSHIPFRNFDGLILPFQQVLSHGDQLTTSKSLVVSHDDMDFVAGNKTVEFFVSNSGKSNDRVNVSIVPRVKRRVCNESNNNVVVELFSWSESSRFPYAGFHDPIGSFGSSGIDLAPGCVYMYFPYGVDTHFLASHFLEYEYFVKKPGNTFRESGGTTASRANANITTKSFNNDDIIVKGGSEDYTEAITYSVGTYVYYYKNATVEIEERPSLIE